MRIEGWARDGLTDAQIAHNINIHVSTLCEWKDKYPQLAEALKRGKAPVDIEVENTLLKTALGYTITVKEPVKVKIEKFKPGTGRIVEERVEMVEREVHVPPNITAQIFWLKNRRPDRWRDKPIETSTTDEPVRIVIDV